MSTKINLPTLADLSADLGTEKESSKRLNHKQRQGVHCLFQIIWELKMIKPRIQTLIISLLSFFIMTASMLGVVLSVDTGDIPFAIAFGVTLFQTPLMLLLSNNTEGGQ